jgi:tetrahydromethanopterin S-methyltransferase subunit D
MANKTTVEDLAEAEAIIAKTLQVAAGSGLGVGLLMGAMMATVAKHFIQLEQKGLPPESFDRLMDITKQLVQRHRG